MKISEICRTGLSLFILIVAFAFHAVAASGDLDPSFGSGGKVVLSSSGSTSYLGVREFPDGKLLVFGGTTRILTQRLNLDGSLDRSFGGGWGGLTTYVAANPYVVGRPLDVEVLSDGSVIVVGSYRVVPDDGTTRAAMWRFDANGVLDPNFGADGRFTLASTPGSAVQVEERLGKLFVMFTRSDGTYLSRRSSNGAPDFTFGSLGLVQLSSSGSTSPSDMKVASLDGRIFVIRLGSLRRYSNDGSADASFGIFGTAQKPVYSDTCDYTENAESYSFTKLNFAPDGKLVIGGYAAKYSGQPGLTYHVAGVSRHTANGLIDSIFNGGVIVCGGQFFSPLYSSGGVQSDKEIIFARGGYGPETVRRLNLNGTVDLGYEPVGDALLQDHLLQKIDEKAVLLFQYEIHRRLR